MYNPIPFYVTSLDVVSVRPQTGRVNVAPRNYHMLSYCVQGKMDLTTGKHSVISHPGSIVFIPAGMAYTSNIELDREIIAVHFQALGNLPQDIQVIVPSQTNSLADDFRSLLDLYESSHANNGFSCMARFYNLLGKIFDGNDFRANLLGYDHRILPALNYLNEHYADVSTTDVEHLAALCGFSSTYLRKLFMNEFGMSPSNYIKQFRIRRAQSLLNTGYYSITEVATRCGFNSASYFAKEFKRHTGFTPSEYLLIQTYSRERNDNANQNPACCL